MPPLAPRTAMRTGIRLRRVPPLDQSLLSDEGSCPPYGRSDLVIHLVFRQLRVGQEYRGYSKEFRWIRAIPTSATGDTGTPRNWNRYHSVPCPGTPLNAELSYEYRRSHLYPSPSGRDELAGHLWEACPEAGAAAAI